MRITEYEIQEKFRNFPENKLNALCDRISILLEIINNLDAEKKIQIAEINIEGIKNMMVSRDLFVFSIWIFYSALLWLHPYLIEYSSRLNEDGKLFFKNCVKENFSLYKIQNFVYKNFGSIEFEDFFISL